MSGRRCAWALPTGAVAFAVPTGNFGNVYRRRVAAAMGLPVPGWSSPPTRTTSWPASSPTGRYERGAVVATTSPSMDIQVASNFERLLLELEGGDAARHARAHAGASRRAAASTLGAAARAMAAVRRRQRRSGRGRAPPSPRRCAPPASWSTRIPPWASPWPRRQPAAGRRRWSPSPPPIRPNSRTPSRPLPASARRCPPATPT